MNRGTRMKRGYQLLISVAVIAAIAGILVFHRQLLSLPWDEWAKILEVAAPLSAGAYFVWRVSGIDRVLRKGQPPTPEELAAARNNLLSALSGAWGDEVSEVYQDEPMRVSFSPWTPPRDPRSPGLRAGESELPGHEPGSPPQKGDFASIAEIFAAPPRYRRVILGAAGAGKSVLVAELQRKLIETPAPGDPVPVIVRAATWKKEQSLLDWLSERLSHDYGWLEPAHARALVARGLVLPIIDGLDEMPPDEHCEAINRINKHHIYRPLILTSREEAFAAATGHASIKNCLIVKLEPLAQPDVTAYLKHTAAGGVWTRVLAWLPDNAPLRQVLGNPLMLYLARREYEHADPRELAYFGRQAAIKEYLLDRFVPAVYPVPADKAGGKRGWFTRRKSGGFSCTAEQAQRWLGHLSPLAVSDSRLDTDQARSDDPPLPELAWWEASFAAGRWPALGTIVRGALRWTAAGAVAVWVLSRTGNWRDGAYAGPVNFTSLLLSGPVGRLIRPTAHTLGIAATREFGHSRLTTWGRVIGYYFAHSALVVLTAAVLLAVAAVFTISGGSAGPAHFPRRLKVSAPQIAARTFRGCRTFFFLALVPSVVLLWLAHWPGGSAAFWHARSTWIALASVTLLGLWTAATALDVPSETVGDLSPKESLRHDREAAAVRKIGLAAIVSVQVWLLCGPLLTRAYVAYSAATILIGLVLGGQNSYASRSYTDARYWLAATDRAPWRMMAFLRDASDRGVLRQVGAVYQVRHAELFDQDWRQKRSRVARWRSSLWQMALVWLRDLQLGGLSESDTLQNRCADLGKLDLNDPSTIAGLPDTLDDLAVRLWRFGPRRLPQSAAGVLVVYTGLARADPEAFRPGQARALHKLKEAITQGSALGALREAAQAYRALAAADPGAHLCGQVEVEGHYADLLGQLGWTGKALTMMRNMVAVAHGHAEAEPETCGPALTAALKRLGSRLPGTHEKVVVQRAAIAACHELAIRQPDRYLANLACLSDVLAADLDRFRLHPYYMAYPYDYLAASRQALAAYLQVADRVAAIRESLAADRLAGLLAASRQPARQRLATRIRPGQLAEWAAAVGQAAERARERAASADPEALPELAWAVHGLALELRGKARWLSAWMLDRLATDINFSYLQAVTTGRHELDLEWLRKRFVPAARRLWEQGLHAEALSADEASRILFPRRWAGILAPVRACAEFALVTVRAWVYIALSLLVSDDLRPSIREEALDLHKLTFELWISGRHRIARAAAAQAAAVQAISVDSSTTERDSAKSTLARLRAARQAIASTPATTQPDPAGQVDTTASPHPGEGRSLGIDAWRFRRHTAETPGISKE